MYEQEENKLPVKFTVNTGDKEISISLPSDCDANEVMDAVYTMMIGMTFQHDTILDAMQGFVDEYRDWDETTQEPAE